MKKKLEHYIKKREETCVLGMRVSKTLADKALREAERRRITLTELLRALLERELDGRN